LISAAADGPAIWADTGSTLIRLQVKTPAATQHPLQNARSNPRRGHMQATAPGIRTGSSACIARHHLARQPTEPIRQGGWGERFRHAVLFPGFCGGTGVASEPGTRPDLRSGRRR
jgi:hypothetical protein